MESKFANTFKGLVDDVQNIGSLEKVKAEFKGSSPLSRKYQELQGCFDAMIAANSPGRQNGLRQS